MDPARKPEPPTSSQRPCAGFRRRSRLPAARAARAIAALDATPSGAPFTTRSCHVAHIRIAQRLGVLELEHGRESQTRCQARSHRQGEGNNRQGDRRQDQTGSRQPREECRQGTEGSRQARRRSSQGTRAASPLNAGTLPVLAVSIPQGRLSWSDLFAPGRRRGRETASARPPEGFPFRERNQTPIRENVIVRLPRWQPQSVYLPFLIG